MKNKFSYVEKQDRKTILLLSDDFRLHSGVATMAREIILNTCHHFNWVNLGAAVKHPDAGKVLDVSADVAKTTEVEDASVVLLPNTGYGDPATLRRVIAQFNPDAVLAFTDPRYWVWLFEMEREVRNKIPLFYLNIWDDLPAPLYNKSYYESCDLLMAISKQTKLINELVLGEAAEDKVITYVPHGVDPQHFFPVRATDEHSDKLKDFKKALFDEKEYEFVVFFNSRNIQRKHPGDVIFSYKIFCDLIGEEAAKKCALVMHTQPVDQHGTDLYAVREAICDPEYVNVYFSTDKLETAQLNLLYNIADVSMLISSNEGWGLSLTESMMAGTMIIANTTGGMQDQMMFIDDNGEWYTPTEKVPSNHKATYLEHGEWAQPVYPSTVSMVGSLTTPYIFDDRCEPEEVAYAIREVYRLSKEERDKKGLAGRQWALSDQARMSSEGLGKNIILSCEEAFEKFKPRTRFDLIKVTDRPKKYVKHTLHGY